jgi:hypothetical protein
MSARACNECGAPAASDDDSHCEVCGGSLEPRRLHEGSEVRVEPSRLGAAMPNASPIPDRRWSRVSDHPGADLGDSKEIPQLLNSPQPAATELSPAQDSELAVQPEAAVPLAHATQHSDIAVVPGSVAAPVVSPKPPAPVPAPIASPVATPRRPPVLASEALLRDIAPSRPARNALRVWCPLLGVLGAANAWLLTRGQGMGWPLAGAFCALALLGLPPMPYSGRASAVSTVSATALALLFWSDGPSEGGASRAMLTVAVNLLATGLLFRSWHRASLVARVIVGAGIALSSLHLWLSHELQELTLADVTWQSWLPRIVVLVFCLLLLLSLLAFMDARSTGGASVWAAFILIWQGLHSAVTIVHAAWPKDAETFDLALVPSDTLLAWTSTPLLSGLLTIGLAQLLAAGLASAAQRHNTTSMRPPPSSFRRLSPVPRSPHH